MSELKKIISILLFCFVSSFTALGGPDSNSEVKSVTSDFIARQYMNVDDWLAVNISGIPADNKFLERFTTVTVPLFSDKNGCRADNFWAKVLAEILEERLKHKKLIIYSRNGEGYNIVPDLLLKTKINHERMYFLKGGSNTFEQYYKSLKIENPSLFDKIQCRCN